MSGPPTGSAPAALARERTALSWSRTAIAVMAYAALVAHAGVSGGRTALVLAAGVLGAAAVAVRVARRPVLATTVVGLAGLVALLAAALPPVPG